MATFLIIILAALGVVLLIVVLGLLLAQLLINKADTVQTRANIISEQQQQQEGVVVDIDELPGAQYQPGMTVISNDVIEGTAHRHHHLNKKTISVIDHCAQSNMKNISTEHINGYKNPTLPIKTDSNAISSDISIVNPLTDKITLEY